MFEIQQPQTGPRNISINTSKDTYWMSNGKIWHNYAADFSYVLCKLDNIQKDYSVQYAGNTLNAVNVVGILNII